MLKSNITLTYLQDTLLCFTAERSKTRNTDVHYSHCSTRSSLCILFPVTQAWQCPTLTLPDRPACYYKCTLIQIISLLHYSSFPLHIFPLINLENASFTIFNLHFFISTLNISNTNWLIEFMVIRSSFLFLKIDKKTNPVKRPFNLINKTITRSSVWKVKLEIFKLEIKKYFNWN